MDNFYQAQAQQPYYQQPQPMMGGYNPYYNQGVPVYNNGVAFGDIQSPKMSTSTAEEMQIIKSKAGNKFDFNEIDDATASWDYRDGSELAIEVIDPEHERVRARWTGEEFNIVTLDVSVLNKLLDLLHNFVSTTKLVNTNLDPMKSKEIYRAFGILNKLLPIAYTEGQKNYNNVFKQLGNAVQSVGYMGQQPYYQYGAMSNAPGYTISTRGSTWQPQPQPYYGGYQQTPYYQAPQNPYGMGTPSPVPGANPFMQGSGAPMNVPMPGTVNNPVPAMNNNAPTPAPGAPTGYQPPSMAGSTPTLNPAIGAAATPTPGTTATAKI